MSSPNGDVCGIDEPRHGGLVRRLSGAKIVVEASVMVVVAADVWIPGHRGMIHALAVVGDAAVDAGTNTENAGAVAENGGFDERRRELRPRLNWTDSNHVGEVDRQVKHTQRMQMYSPKGREGPGLKRGHQRQESGRKNLDP